MQATRRHLGGVCIFCRHARPSLTTTRLTPSRRSLYVPRNIDPRELRDHRDDDDDTPPIRSFMTGKGSGPRESRHGHRGTGKDGRRSSNGDRHGSRHRGPPGQARGGKYGREQSRSLPFKELLQERLKAVRRELEIAPLAKSLEDEGTSFGSVWGDFCEGITKPQFSNSKEGAGGKTVLGELRAAFQDRGEGALDDRIKYAFYGHFVNARFTESDIRNQKALADLRYPAEWFPATRSFPRTIHMHVGPTNSGKTYHALKRLETANSGIYAGPLRLLAHEVFTRLNAKGKRCVLVTGEERRSPDESLQTEMSSCTVEMMPMNKTVDVAVIDEIQMIGNAERGWAWTQALLGVKAHEVHLCGEARTVPIVRELCASVGEKVIVHEYERLSPLQMAEKSLGGNLKDLRKGDCIVSFSVVGIHSLRRTIERATGKKVAIVYGSLPPETRAQQARLFNDPDNDFDFLVASDAIGMGLNLSIKRVIFETSMRFDGYRRKPLPIADVKQIGGRAGRYKTAHDANSEAQSALDMADQDLSEAKGESAHDTAVEKVSVLEPALAPRRSLRDLPPSGIAADEPYHRLLPSGALYRPRSVFLSRVDPEGQIVKDVTDKAAQPDELAAAPEMETRAPLDPNSAGQVTTLDHEDFNFIKRAMSSEPEPITSAGLFPPSPIVERFAQYFPPGTPFSFVLLRLHELSQMHSRFHLCGLRDQLYIADLIEPVRDLTIADRIIISAAPASKTDVDLFRELLPALARCIEQQSGGSLLDIPEMPLEVLDEQASPSREYLRNLERLHKGIITYLWLSYRFAGIFTTRSLALHVKELVEKKIEDVLSGMSFTEGARKAALERQRKKEMERDEFAAAEGGGAGEDQSSLVAGGDRFGGEEDEMLMEPEEAEGVDAPARRGVEYDDGADRELSNELFNDDAANGQRGRKP